MCRRKVPLNYAPGAGSSWVGLNRVVALVVSDSLPCVGFRGVFRIVVGPTLFACLAS